MKSKITFWFLGLMITINLLISGCSKNSVANTSDRNRLFNTGWKFVRDSITGAEKPEYDDSKWMAIDLPHDYSIMDLPGKDGPDQIGPFSRKSPGNDNSTGQVIGGTQDGTAKVLLWIKLMKVRQQY
jgi:beta-galactosidase